MPGDLVELARFPSSAEASIVRSRLDAEGIRAELDGEAAASWLWHLGSAIGGVRVLINEDDADRALEILRSDTSIDESQDIDFGDKSADVPDREASELPIDLMRAWRASLIGFFLLPPVLNLYSTWLLFRHQFFLGQCHNWRVVATCFANAFVFALVVWFSYLIARPPEPPAQEFTSEGEPVKYETETSTIPIVPPIVP